MSAAAASATDPSVLVPVFRDKYPRGWPDHEQPRPEDVASYMPPGLALAVYHRTDAHFTAYSLPHVERRLAGENVWNHVDGVRMVLFVVDVDLAEHAKVTPEWWTAERSKIDRLLAAHPGGFVYRTRGGYRIVYVLAEPVVLTSVRCAERWKLRYCAWLDYVQENFAIDGDRACRDWTRFYRLPFVVRDGEPQRLETFGDANAIGAWAVEVEIVEPPATEPARPSRAYTPRSGDFDVRDFMATTYPGVASRSIRGGERWDIPCPWAHEHSTKATRRKTSVFRSDDGRPGFKCQGAHCIDRHWKEFRRWHQPDWIPFDERTWQPRSDREPPPDIGNESGDDVTEDHEYADAPPDFDDVPPPGDDDAPQGRGRKRSQVKASGAVKLAVKYIAENCMHADGPTLRRWRGGWYRWRGDLGCYVELSSESIEADLYRRLELGAHADVSEVRHALIAVDDVLIDHAEIGTWLDDRPDQGDLPEIAACRNGIIHLPSGRLEPASPRFFSMSSLGAAYLPRARQPSRWLAFLEQLWPGDPESIAALQEWFGYLLTADTRQQKIMLIVGPRRSGKGTIARVLARLLGAGNVAAPTLASLGTNFGLSPLIGKTAAIIGDARLGGRSDIAQIVERLLSISGEDPQTVDRKNREHWHGQLSVRFSIISNELPRFTDASDALAGRMLVLELGQSWYGKEDTGLTGALVAELPGVLLWAIEGWHRLAERGRFVQPSASQSAIDDLADLASPIAAWVRQRCRTDEPDEHWWLECTEAYSQFKAWAEANGHKSIPTQTVFGRDIKTAVGTDRVQITRGGKRTRVYRGLVLQ